MYFRQHLMSIISAPFKALYAVLGYDPKTVADFAGVKNNGDEYYRVNGSETDFDTMFTYTGASNKTMVDSDGLLKWAPHNYATYSEELDNAAWSKTGVSITANNTTAPDGSSNADKIVEDSGTSAHVAQSPSAGYTGISTVSYTAVAWVKQAERSLAEVWMITAARTIGSGIRIDLTDGSFVSQRDVGGSTLDSYSIVDAGNGWYKISVSATNGVTNKTCAVFVVETGTPTTTVSYTGDGSSGVYAWGGHVYRSDLGGMVDNPDRGDSYVPTTSSAVYLSRRNSYRYDGGSVVKKGITLESAATTNLCTQSRDISTWTSNGITITDDIALGPDGEISLARITANGGSTEHRLEPKGLAGTLSSNVDYCISAYVSYDTQQYVMIWLFGATNNWAAAIFDILNGTVTDTETGSSGGTVTATNVEDVGNGIYRITAVLKSSNTSGTDKIGFLHVTSGTWSGSSTTGQQINSLTTRYNIGFVDVVSNVATPSSHIPTSGATATRAAETLRIAGADMAYSSTAMSIHMHCEVNYADTNVGIGSFDLFGWDSSGDDLLSAYGDTDRGTGGITSRVRDITPASIAFIESNGSLVSPGINVDMNYASRYTSSAFNCAYFGTADTQTAYPSGNMPDLASVPFQFGEIGFEGATSNVFTGNIHLMRQWDVDLGDSGIEEASS